MSFNGILEDAEALSDTIGLSLRQGFLLILLLTILIPIGIQLLTRTINYLAVKTWNNSFDENAEIILFFSYSTVFVILIIYTQLFCVLAFYSIINNLEGLSGTLAIYLLIIYVTFIIGLITLISLSFYFIGINLNNPIILYKKGKKYLLIKNRKNFMNYRVEDVEIDDYESVKSQRKIKNKQKYIGFVKKNIKTISQEDRETKFIKFVRENPNEFLFNYMSRNFLSIFFIPIKEYFRKKKYILLSSLTFIIISFLILRDYSSIFVVIFIMMNLLILMILFLGLSNLLKQLEQRLLREKEIIFRKTMRSNF